MHPTIHTDPPAPQGIGRDGRGPRRGHPGAGVRGQPDQARAGRLRFLFAAGGARLPPVHRSACRLRSGGAGRLVCHPGAAAGAGAGAAGTAHLHRRGHPLLLRLLAHDRTPRRRSRRALPLPLRGQAVGASAKATLPVGQRDLRRRRAHWPAAGAAVAARARPALSVVRADLRRASTHTWEL
eukprot:scaffold1883_cov108-Isochrysis_galbana.AAC.11